MRYCWAASLSSNFVFKLSKETLLHYQGLEKINISHLNHQLFYSPTIRNNWGLWQVTQICLMFEKYHRYISTRTGVKTQQKPNTDHRAYRLLFHLWKCWVWLTLRQWKQCGKEIKSHSFPLRLIIDKPEEVEPAVHHSRNCCKNIQLNKQKY